MNSKFVFVGLFLFALILLSSNVSVEVKAAEYDNVETFNIHPASRWFPDYTTSDETLTVNNSILTYSDEGDPLEKSVYTRDLLKDDFKIEGRIKTPSIESYGGVWENTTNQVFHFDAEEGTGATLNDDSGLNHDGTMVDYIWSNDTFNPSLSNYSVFFEAQNTTTEISLGDHSDFTFGDGVVTDYPFSYSCWFKSNDTNVRSYLLGKDRDYLPSVSEYAISIGLDDISVIFADLHNDEYVKESTNSNILSDNTWHFLTVTYNGVGGATAYLGIKIYLDGVQVASSGVGSGGYDSMHDTIEKLKIAGYDIGSTGANLYLDEMTLWDGELSSSDIGEIYGLFYPTDELVDTIIGISDKHSLVDMDDPELGIVFQTYSPLANVSECIVYYVLDEYRVNFFNLSLDTWYRFDIKINLPKSYVKWEINTDTGVSITNSDKEQTDITTSNPSIFSKHKPKLFFGNLFNSSSTISWQLDYINAPYEEYDFRLRDDLSSITGSTNTFKSFSVYGSYIDLADGVEVVDEYAIWELSIPLFDSASGTISMTQRNDALYGGETMEVRMEIQLIQYNPVSGAATNLAALRCKFLDQVPYVQVINSTDDVVHSDLVDVVALDDIDVSFTFYKTPDYEIILQMAYEDKSYAWNFPSSFNASEYGLRVLQFAQAGENSYGKYNVGLQDFEFARADIFGFIPDVGDVIGGLFGGFFKFLLLPFTIGFKFLGGTFARVMEPVAAILGKILSPLISILAAIGALAAEVGAAIWSTITSGLTTLFEAALLIVDEIAGFFRALGAWILTNIIDPMFGGVVNWFWILVDLFIIVVGYFQFIYDTSLEWGPVFFLCLTGYIWLGSTKDAKNMIDYMSNVIDRLARDIAGGHLSILGFSVPIPLGIPWGILFAYFLYKGGIINLV
jgi:hypothetical protein